MLPEITKRQMAVKEMLQLVVEAMSDESIAPEQRMDKAEMLLSKFPQVECPLYHQFCGGMYVRELSVPAGAILTSVTHLQKHPLFILKGELCVYWIENGTVFTNTFTAPAYTITNEGTRRFTLVTQDCNAVAVFRTDALDPDKAMLGLIDSRKNPLLSEDFVPGWKIANQKNKALQ